MVESSNAFSSTNRFIYQSTPVSVWKKAHHVKLWNVSTYLSNQRDSEIWSRIQIGTVFDKSLALTYKLLLYNALQTFPVLWHNVQFVSKWKYMDSMTCMCYVLYNRLKLATDSSASHLHFKKQSIPYW